MKNFIRYAFAILLLLIIGFFVANYYVSNKIKNLLAEENSLTYNDLEVNTFSGNLNFKDVLFEASNKKIKIKEIDLEVDILHYLFNKEVKIKNIDADGLDLNFMVSSDSTTKKTPKLEVISIDKINLKNSSISIKDNSKSIFTTSNLNLQAENISWPLDENFEWLKNNSLSISAESLTYNLNELHNLKADEFSLEDASIFFKNFKIEPKYSKANYINKISTQKDLMDLRTKSLKISDFGLQKKDSLLHISSHKIRIESSNFNVYRDKTIAEDKSIKPLYSKALRDLGFQISIDTVTISEMTITYEELLDKSQKAGKIQFNSTRGHIVNLHNVKDRKEPSIKANLKAKFTNQSEIYFSLNFEPDYDHFYASTLLKKVEAKSINSFLAQAMRLELEGEIDEIKTSFSGNNSEMKGDFKIAYKKLKLNVLKKDGSKNNFASLFSNVFVKNKNVDKSFSLEEVKRNTTKSFWNYIWTFHLEGMKKSLL